MESCGTCLFVKNYFACIMSPRFIHFVAYDSISFLTLKNILLAHAIFCLSTHLSQTVSHLFMTANIAAANIAATNIGVQTPETLLSILLIYTKKWDCWIIR